MTQEFRGDQGRLVLSNTERTFGVETARLDKPGGESSLFDSPVTNGLAIGIVVDTADDVVDANDGLTSLREAITMANSNADFDQIRFDSSLVGSVLRLSSTLTISEDVDIDGDITGNGFADITISGDAGNNDFTRLVESSPGQFASITNVAANSNDSDNVRIFAINGATTSASLSNLVLTGGVDATGGGALNVFSAAVTLDNVVVGGNEGGTGGGIRNDRGDLTVLNSLVTFNASTSSGGGIGLLAGAASLSILNTNVSNNTAGTDGGGILIGNMATISGANVSIFDNTAADDGGGLNVVGGSGTLVNATIAGNVAADDGGGIARNLGGDLTLVNSTITGNASSDNVASGGGIAISGSGDVILTNSILLGNFNAVGEDEAVNFQSVVTIVEMGPNIIGSGDASVLDVFGALIFEPVSGVTSGLIADNGGPVQTVRLRDSATNPALDTASSILPTEVDLNLDVNGDGIIAGTSIDVDARGGDRGVNF
ncbi:MAG: hypothetical protein AAFR20_02525, partial [Pseudomonadota bacterium]